MLISYQYNADIVDLLLADTDLQLEHLIFLYMIQDEFSEFSACSNL